MITLNVKSDLGCDFGFKFYNEILDVADKIRIIGKALGYDLKYDWMKDPDRIEKNILDLLNIAANRLSKGDTDCICECMCLRIIGFKPEDNPNEFNFLFNFCL